MRNCGLLLLVALAVFGSHSCTKNNNPPIDYLVDTTTNIYLNQDDSLHVPLEVRFLTGAEENVSLTFEGLPSTVRSKQDTITGLPTYTANFVLYTTPGAPLGSYPIKLVAYSPSTGYRTYALNLRVVHYDCSNYLSGAFNCSNACKTNYTYTATATAVGNNRLNLSNFGGYGLGTNTVIDLNCNTDSVTIATQNIGNGVTVTGQGHFESNKMVIRYVALNIPTGGNDTCVVTMTK